MPELTLSPQSGTNNLATPYVLGREGPGPPYRQGRERKTRLLCRDLLSQAFSKHFKVCNSKIQKPGLRRLDYKEYLQSVVWRWRESSESRIVWKKNLRLGCCDYFYYLDAQLTKYIRMAGPLLNIILVFVHSLLSIMYSNSYQLWKLHCSKEHKGPLVFIFLFLPWYTVKKVHEFPISSQDVTNQTPPGQE